jgi:hypothetical protein
MPTYDKIQFIAYEIHTGPKLLGQKMYYLGLDNEYDDIAARLNWTYEVLQQAATRADGSPKTLKLLMLPEFYFRGAKGAYSLDIVSKLIDGLQHLVRGGDWTDWLFVFGTIVGVSSPTRYTPTGFLDKLWRKILGEDLTPIDPNAPKEVYNFALAQKGGWAPSSNMMTPAQMNEALEGTAFITLKEYKSNIDFIKVTQTTGRAGYVWERVLHLDRIGGPSTGSTVQGREERLVGYDGASLFEVDGIQFGLEICLDHAQQRLKNSPRPPSGSPVQIQLVPSCGLELKANAMVAMTGGYGFNVDGWYKQVLTDPTRSQVAMVTQAYSLAQPDATLGPNIAAASNLPLVAPQGFDKLYALGAGSLSFYTPIDVPGGDPPSARGETSRRTTTRGSRR